MPDILETAYRHIRKLYHKEGLKPGVLEYLAIKPEWTAILASQDQAGVALNFTGDHAVGQGEDREGDIQAFRRFVGKDLFVLVDSLLAKDDLQGRAISLAALNALSNPFTDPEAMKARGLDVSIDSLRPFVRSTDKAALVGYGGFVRHFVGKAAQVHVTDLRPPESFRSLVIGKEVFYGPQAVKIHHASENSQVLGSSDIVMVTGSTLVNRSFEEVMGWASSARVRGVYGPSAALVPEILLEAGANFVLSYRIKDCQRFAFDLINDLDMEVGLERYQDCYHIYTPELF